MHTSSSASQEQAGGVTVTQSLVVCSTPTAPFGLLPLVRHEEWNLVTDIAGHCKALIRDDTPIVSINFAEPAAH